MLYMDNAATTPMLSVVIDTMAEVMRKYYGNPSSLHRLGMDSEMLIRRARESVAFSMLCKPEEIIFTSGGTESNNLAILGAVRRYRDRGKHLITTEIEHASVYETFRKLEQEGYRVTYLKPDSSGRITAEAVERALNEDTVLVSVMHVNNEIGSVQPVSEIGRLLKSRRKVLYHVDAVQSIGKLPVNPEQMGVDYLSCSAHKLHGPKGIGFLYCRTGIGLEPLVYGGGQERGLRSGTENVAAIVGMAKALRIAVEEQKKFSAHTAKLREYITRRIGDIRELQLTGSERPDDMAPHIVHFSFPGMKSEVIVHALEQRGVCVSARSACSSGAEKPSRVLLAMGCKQEEAVSGIRISYTLQQTMEDAEKLCSALQEAVSALAPNARTRQHGGKL